MKTSTGQQRRLTFTPNVRLEENVILVTQSWSGLSVSEMADFLTQQSQNI